MPEPGRALASSDTPMGIYPVFNHFTDGVSMLEVPLSAFAAAHSDGAIVVDVREPGEYVGGHVPGATLVPMGQVPSRMSELPRDKTIYLICASGNRSLSTASYLIRAGYDAHSVTGGTGAWARAGHPVVRGHRPNAA